MFGLCQLVGVACRVKQGLSSSPQYPQVLKKNEQMYALLALVLSLCPAAQSSLEEGVTSQLREKCAPISCLAISLAEQAGRDAGWQGHQDRGSDPESDWRV